MLVTMNQRMLGLVASLNAMIVIVTNTVSIIVSHTTLFLRQ